MKKFFTVVSALVVVSFMSTAQNAETGRARNGESVKKAEGVDVRVSNASAVESKAVKGEMAAPKVTAESLQASIRDLEKEMNERKGTEGFDENAYRQRISILSDRLKAIQSEK
jgi:hypothetical protein